MERYLITQSLLSSWAYTFDCFEGGEDEAREDFIRTLRREKGETTAYMQSGIDFEDAVYAEAAHERRVSHPEWENGIQQVASIIEGAPVQVKAQRDLNVDGVDYLVYGVLDALKAGVIYDVKFVNKSFNSLELAGKYLDSAQHPAYFYIVPEATEFQYLVSDGSDVYIERYTRGQTRFIGDIIADFIASIRDMGLLELYKEHWLAL